MTGDVVAIIRATVVQLVVAADGARVAVSPDGKASNAYFIDLSTEQALQLRPDDVVELTVRRAQ